MGAHHLLDVRAQGAALRAGEPVQMAEKVLAVGQHGVGGGVGDGVEVLDLRKGVVDVDDGQQVGQGRTFSGSRGRKAQ